MNFQKPADSGVTHRVCAHLGRQPLPTLRLFVVRLDGLANSPCPHVTAPLRLAVLGEYQRVGRLVGGLLLKERDALGSKHGMPHAQLRWLALAMREAYLFAVK